MLTEAKKIIESDIDYQEKLAVYLVKFTTESSFSIVCNSLAHSCSDGTSHAQLLRDIVSTEIDDGQKGRNCLTIARWCLNDKNYPDAIGFIMKSMMFFPRTWAAHNLLRISCEKCGLYEEAAECSKRNIPEFLKKIFLKNKIRYADVLNSSHDSVIVHQAFDSELTELVSPRSINSRIHKAYDHKTIVSNPAYTVAVENGALWFDGFNILAWDRQGAVIRNASAGHFDVINDLKESEEPSVLAGTVCFLGNRVASNYYHWMNDIVPRLGVLKDSGLCLESIDWFVLPAIQKSFQKDTLKHFNINSDRIHRFTQGKYIQADMLLMPVYGSNEHLVRVDAEQWTNLHSLQSARSSQFLNSSFTSALPDAIQSNSAPRLYLSRGSESSRSISNEEELLVFLEKYGFTKIQLEKYSVAEQVNLFRNAEIVFGPHGAGFSNIVFCKKGTKIIEVFQDYTASCFWFISEFMKHAHYVHQFTKKTEEITDIKKSRKYSSTQERDRLAQFEVDMNELEQLFRFAEIYPVDKI